MTIPRLSVPIKGITESVDPRYWGRPRRALAVLLGGDPAIIVAFVSDWIADFFIYILTGILGFITTPRCGRDAVVHHLR